MEINTSSKNINDNNDDNENIGISKKDVEKNEIKVYNNSYNDEFVIKNKNISKYFVFLIK